MFFEKLLISFKKIIIISILFSSKGFDLSPLFLYKLIFAAIIFDWLKSSTFHQEELSKMIQVDGHEKIKLEGVRIFRQSKNWNTVHPYNVIFIETINFNFHVYKVDSPRVLGVVSHRWIQDNFCYNKAKLSSNKGLTRNSPNQLHTQICQHLLYTSLFEHFICKLQEDS